MESVVHDQINVDSRRLEEQTFLSKSIRLQQTEFLLSYSFLMFLVDTIEGAKIQVGRRIRNVFVIGIAAKDVCVFNQFL